MRKLKEIKGITLIALVITIIILLILAGVSIATLTGENGILGQAKKAKEKTEQAQKDEELSLKEIESTILGYTDPWSGNAATGFATGSGTEQNPYIIENGEQLAYLANQVNNGETYEGKYIKITKSINLDNKKWTPIGIGSNGARGEAEWNMTNSFKGNLNGDGNIITKLNIEELNTHGVGLVGTLEESGVVENIHVYEGKITGKTCVAGVVGANKGTVRNCTNKSSIIAQDNEDSNSGQMAGGIVGWIERGTIENCRNYGSVITRDDSLKVSRGKSAGGIAGYLSGKANVTIKGCTNSGEIRCMYQLVGGIVGSCEYNEGTYTIENCTNTGKVVAEYHEFTTSASLGVDSGGIIGWMASGEGIVINCSNSGEIIAEKQQAGGIIGQQSAGTVESCTNTGKVTAKYIEGVANSGLFSGGIVGWQKEGIVKNCSNSEEIIAEKQQAGGIIGQQSAGTVESCTNTGKVTAKYIEGVANSGGFAGGIIGWMVSGEGTVKNCSNSGEIIAEWQQAGGIIGQQSAGTVENCSNSGKIIAKSQGARGISGGIIGAQAGGEIINVYNLGQIEIGDFNGKIDAIGGIIGYQNAGTISRAYNKGILTGGEAIGTIIGQKKLAGIVEKTYYFTNENIKAIGSETDDTTVVTPAEDVNGKTEKAYEDIDTFEKFIQWIKNK